MLAHQAGEFGREEQVNLKHLIEDILGEVLSTMAQIDSCIVDQDVDLAGLGKLDCWVDDLRLDVFDLHLGDVGLDGGDHKLLAMGADLLELVNCWGWVCSWAVDEDDLTGALFAEAGGDAEADA